MRGGNRIQRLCRRLSADRAAKRLPPFCLYLCVVEPLLKLSTCQAALERIGRGILQSLPHVLVVLAAVVIVDLPSMHGTVAV